MYEKPQRREFWIVIHSPQLSGVCTFGKVQGSWQSWGILLIGVAWNRSNAAQRREGSVRSSWVASKDQRKIENELMWSSDNHGHPICILKIHTIAVTWTTSILPIPVSCMLYCKLGSWSSLLEQKRDTGRDGKMKGFFKMGIFCRCCWRNIGIHVQTAIVKPQKNTPDDFWKSGGHSSSTTL